MKLDIRFPHYIKKEENTPILRADIQYEFLKLLFSDNTRAFTDPYPNSKIRIGTKVVGKHHMLTFNELYAKTLANILGRSKIITKRILLDNNDAKGLLKLFFIINISRVGSRMTFLPNTMSVSRQYHTIPCLQLGEGATSNTKPNIFPETNSLKSILNQCMLSTSEAPASLKSLQKIKHRPKTPIFHLINMMHKEEEYLDRKHFANSPYGFYDIFKNGKLDPKRRVEVFLWLVYSYLESSSSESEGTRPFGSEIPELVEATYDFDIDTKEEIEFGKAATENRMKFLDNVNGTKKKSYTSTGGNEKSKNTQEGSKRGRGRPRKDGKPPKPTKYTKPERPIKVQSFIEDDEDEDEEEEFEESEFSDDSADGFEEWDEDEENDNDAEEQDEDSDEELESEFEEEENILKQANEYAVGESSRKTKKPIQHNFEVKLTLNSKSSINNRDAGENSYEDNQDHKLKRKKIEVQVQPRVPIKQLKLLPNPTYPLVDPSIGINESLNKLFVGFVQHFGKDAIGA